MNLYNNEKPLDKQTYVRYNNSNRWTQMFVSVESMFAERREMNDTQQFFTVSEYGRGSA